MKVKLLFISLILMISVNAQTITFGAATNTPYLNGSRSVCIGDFNVDGLKDFAFVNQAQNSIYVGFGDGSGNSALNATLTSSSGTSVVTDDFNGDGKLDLVCANLIMSTITLYTGFGNGTFAAGITYSVANPTYLAVGDFNNDNLPDIITDSAKVLINNGAGFNSAIANGTFSQTQRITVSDFNNDGNKDVVFGVYQGVNILYGNGNGTFGAPIYVATSTAITSIFDVRCADFNGDNFIDIVCVNSATSANSVSVIKNNAGGSFTVVNTYTLVGTNPQTLTVADFNSDGKMDVVTGNYGNSSISILRGNGDLTFTNQGDVSVPGSKPQHIVVNDVNNDGKQDIIIARGVTTTAVGCVLLNQSSLATENFNFKNAFKLYPNPSAGLVNISTVVENIGAKVEVTNILGQKINSFELTHLENKTSLDKGIYIFTIIKDKNKSSYKVIVK